MKTPVNFSIDFDLTVDNIYHNDRYFEMGFMTYSQMIIYKTKLMGKYMVGGYSYCGYKSMGMKGTLLNYSLSSLKGLENGVKIRFTYDHKKRYLEITNSKKMKIYNTIPVNKKGYHLYFILYFPNQIGKFKINETLN